MAKKKETAEKSDGYTIGITISFNADGTPGLYENGLRQNVLMLYRLFAAAPKCRKVYLLNHADAELRSDQTLPGVPRSAVVRTPSVINKLDAVVVIGAAIDRPTMIRLRERGCKIIKYKGGNGAVISMEAMAARPPRQDAERYFDWDMYDAIWMTPQHIHTFKGWAETIYRLPVEEIPQIWEPLFINTARDEIRDQYGYRPGLRPWRVSIMDPNITVMKTSHMPMAVCEAAYRKMPELFKSCYVTNSLQFKDLPHFQSYAMSMSIARAGIMTSETRFVGVEFLANYTDCLVTHHWENGLNYLYYEALYGGYPLIHNSKFLQDYGYYYQDFDPADGGRALVEAHLHHDEHLDDYRARNEQLFARLDPTSAQSQAAHAGRVERMLGIA